MPAPEPARTPPHVDRRTLLIASGTGLAAAGGAAAWLFGPGSDRASARAATAPTASVSVSTPSTPSTATGATTAAPTAPPGPTTVGTTLHSVATPTGKGSYRRLADGPGWKRVVRADLAPAHPGRADRRTAIAAFVQLTDLHVMDVQSPLRMEWMREHGPHDWRPHEALSVLSTLSLIDRVNSLRGGPVTGHPLSFAITTGDNTDNNSTIELDWFLSAMSGGRIDPNTGDPQAFEGIQNSGLPLFWQPESARTDADKKLGFPHLPGYLSAAMRPLTAPGLKIPWYSTVGNHDALFSGAYRSGAHGSFAGQVAVGDRKLEQVPHADMLRVYKAVNAQQDPDGTLVREVLQHYARTARTVTPDVRRAPSPRRSTWPRTSTRAVRAPVRSVTATPPRAWTPTTCTTASRSPTVCSASAWTPPTGAARSSARSAPSNSPGWGAPWPRTRTGTSWSSATTPPTA